MATIDDLFTTQKNGVVALNAIVTAINNQTALTRYLSGQYTSAAVTASTLVASGSGYLVNLSVIDAGSGEGTVNDAASVGAAVAANEMMTAQKFHGVYAAGMRFTDGLVVIPGTGQTIAVTYSLD